MPTPFIRPYDSSRDFEAGLNVFYTTIDPGVSTEPSRTIGSHIWYRPYVILSPESCFMLDSGTGHAVGYIIGAPSTTTFASLWKEKYLPSLDQSIIPPPEIQSGDPAMETETVKGLRKEVWSAGCSMLQSVPAELEKYPAHLHIDILPEFQGQGWGKLMVERFLGYLGEQGVRGVHLGMVRTNEGARRFYERFNFSLCDQVLDNGESQEKGRNGGAICLVKIL
ncbi:GCN5-related N-acetyltransferas-like protein [Corynespora cassiicola Philippines]|uniref:GCN5-related N-acetyltransferas-like protein n=1 Tax=Corynespora cassiicola Philippines TaxID=1448308 RepID=A0A2T2NH35_CORCC|nr:GCN5-related N-acetyltransferas-like protein [Corynespora cassiicola Philippines]